MKFFKAEIRLTGLTGEYTIEPKIPALTKASAEKKANRIIGNRDGYVFSVVEVAGPFGGTPTAFCPSWL